MGTSTAAPTAFGKSRALTATGSAILGIVAEHVGALVFMVAATAETEGRVAVTTAALVVGGVEGVFADGAGDGGEVEGGSEGTGAECLDSTDQCMFKRQRVVRWGLPSSRTSDRKQHRRSACSRRNPNCILRMWCPRSCRSWKSYCQPCFICNSSRGVLVRTSYHAHRSTCQS